MYTDRHLEFERIGKDASALTSRVLPFGQDDLQPLKNAGTTADLSPDAKLFFMVVAGPNDVAAGMTFEFQHSDTKDGTYSTVQIFGPAPAAEPGGILIKALCPQNIKNWTRVVKSVNTPVNIFFTYDVAPKGLPTIPV
jgi:hypothetical protein